MGRDKFGHRFGLNVCRQRADGSYEWLNLEKTGISYSSLSYTTQMELDELLARLADAFETAIVPWLDQKPDECGER
jgi:formylmethanofuran dehydrogenase subunit A